MVPCLTVTLSKPPVLLIPSPVLTPSIVWPPRSTLMLLAPMTRPSPGQSVRSFLTCVLCVITWPHVTFCFGFGLCADAWPAPRIKKAATVRPNRAMRENRNADFEPRFIPTPFFVGGIETEVRRERASSALEITHGLHDHSSRPARVRRPRRRQRAHVERHTRLAHGIVGAPLDKAAPTRPRRRLTHISR